MKHDFSDDDFVYGDSFGFIHRGVLEDREFERMKLLQDKVQGKVGKAITTLKPIGRVEIENEIYEARLRYGYLDVGASVIATGIDTGYIIVSENRTEED
ncbi:NfeD family protein [Listeria sp. PSOL-1]|uniref:NfeD family protein n=1 Tax=Listeria sp. PSOL-1 TaxID=1844999 RepID=UPI0013D161C3|nr:NfeD family protein [Listeria sp. PSOL-1]